MSELNDKNFDPFDGLTEETEVKGIFRKFKRTNVAAVEWINDLILNGYRFESKRGRKAIAEEGLYMSDEMQEVGVLSIAPALSALLMELAELFQPGENDVDGEENKNGDDANNDEDSKLVTFKDMLVKDNSRVLDVITDSVGRLIVECFPKGVGNTRHVLLSSMPFYDDGTLAEGSRWDSGGYLDTASWVSLVADLIENFLDRLETVAPEIYSQLEWQLKGDKNTPSLVTDVLTTEQVKSAVRTLYLNSIQVTCDCILRDKDGEVRGWTFRKMDDSAEPSLYFSYVASTVYLGLYKRFNRGGMIDKLRAFEKEFYEAEENSGFRFYEGILSSEKREKNIDALRKRKGFDKFAEYLDNLSEEEISELDLLYNKINKGEPLTHTIDDSKIGNFTLLKKATVGFADTLWNKGYGNGKRIPFKVNMAKGPCFEDGSLVDLDVVRLSSHNNAFFNNLFVIGIILNSAYDEEVKRKNTDEYDRMLNAFQLSIQNTQRCYDEIANEKLLYKIDSYILDFSDKTDKENEELAKQMRKVNMAVVPLMPLILKNNNLMSQYVVRYPQKQMTESLKDIIRNKKRKDGKSSWVWDKDGYNAITNYYYVDALISFYRYYEEYEEPFIGDEDTIRTNESRARKDERKRLSGVFLKKINELNAQKKANEEYINEVKSISRGIARFVINGLIDIVDEQLTSDNLIGSLSDQEQRTDTVISELNSFDNESDVVKISKLVRLYEKLQILSMLSMDEDKRVTKFLKLGDGNSTHSAILKNVFGENGDSSQFMENILVKISELLMKKD